MKTIITLLITVIAVNSFAQNNHTNISVDTEKLLNLYYPGNKTLHDKVNDFYDSLARCRDASTVDWLFREQGELSALLSRSFEINEKEDSENFQIAIDEAYAKLSHTLKGFEFHMNVHSDAEFEEVEYEDEHQNLLDVFPNMQLILDHAHSCSWREKHMLESGFAIIFAAWGPIKHNYTTYCYDICCDCARESALGSGLHSKLLTSIAIFTAYSNSFSEAFEEIKNGIKYDVLYTHAFSSPKKAILAEFAIIKPLLGLSLDEELIYEKKKIYLEETSESALHNYGR